MLIAYDITLKRPGCVLIQAALGGTVDVSRLFPAESWLLTFTPDMHLYQVTPDQLEGLVEVSARALPG